MVVAGALLVKHSDAELTVCGWKPRIRGNVRCLDDIDCAAAHFATSCPLTYDEPNFPSILFYRDESCPNLDQ